MRRTRRLASSLAVVLLFVGGCTHSQRQAQEPAPVRSSNEGGDFEYREGAVPRTESGSTTLDEDEDEDEDKDKDKDDGAVDLPDEGADDVAPADDDKGAEVDVAVDAESAT